MFRNILFLSFFIFPTGSFADEDPLPKVSIDVVKQVKHSIERIWLSDDAMSCLVQLNASNAPQQSCLSFWKVIEGRRLLFISTRVPFVTDGDLSPIMFTTISSSSLVVIGKVGDGDIYTLFRGPYQVLNWSLSGG